MAGLRLTQAGSFAFQNIFTFACVSSGDALFERSFSRMTSLKVDGISSRTVVADLEYLFEK